MKNHEIWKYLGIMGIGAISFTQIFGSPTNTETFFLLAFTITAFALYYRGKDKYNNEQH